ncbi:MAG: tyrosine recombinase [Clostridia bacterium]|nr:tyrosine recombinase [Clostridia bacterium]
MREHLTGFIGYVSNKSNNTISSYRRDLEKYISFLEKNGIKTFKDTTKTTVLTYLLKARSEGFSDATIRRTLSALKTFYAYLTVESPDIKNPVFDIAAPAKIKTSPKILTATEVDRFLSAPDIKTAKGRRDRAMLEVLYATGIKVTELLELDVGDVNTVAGYLRCTGGMRERILPIGAMAQTAVVRYISNSRDSFLADENEMALFLNYKGERMSRQGFWKIIHFYREKAGIKEEITPQILRNSFAAHMLENGADLGTISELLGHSDISTTRVYSGFLKPNIRDIYQKTHPRA